MTTWRDNEGTAGAVGDRRDVGGVGDGGITKKYLGWAVAGGVAQ
jgi:hypothetical protein